MIYELEDISKRVNIAVDAFNASENVNNKIHEVNLFGSYANGNADENSDVDLFVKFDIPCVSLLTLAKAREAFEYALDKSIDLVQDPLPKDSLLTLNEKVLIYGQ